MQYCVSIYIYILRAHCCVAKFHMVCCFVGWFHNLLQPLYIQRNIRADILIRIVVGYRQFTVQSLYDIIIAMIVTSFVLRIDRQHQQKQQQKRKHRR